jgi:hypothetical protein
LGLGSELPATSKSREAYQCAGFVEIPSPRDPFRQATLEVG